jgi:hypothetical protein
MVTMDDRLAVFLDTADDTRCALFAATCVERGSSAFFLAAAKDGTRAPDSQTFLRLLDDLWHIEAPSEPDGQERLKQISAFRELQGEDEPPGILAYAYDSVAAMFYAYTYLTSNDRVNITYCSNHMQNSAGFLDDAAGTDNSHLDEEITSQLHDIDFLLHSEDRLSSLVDTVRDTARKVGRHRLDALSLSA